MESCRREQRNLGMVVLLNRNLKGMIERDVSSERLVSVIVEKDVERIRCVSLYCSPAQYIEESMTELDRVLTKANEKRW